MSKLTPILKLYEADPVTDANDLFDIDKLMNDNWDKIDNAFGTLTDTTVAGIKTDVKALQDRLDIETVQEKGFAPGSVTVASPKNALYRFTGASGRSLFNLLDRDGNCESLAPWTFTGATGALDSSNKVYGTNAIKLTLTAATGTATRAVSVINGKRYILVGDLKNSNATSLRVFTTGLSGTAVSGTTAATSYLLITAGSTANIQVGVSVTGVAGQVAYMDGIRMYELSVTDYNAANSLNTSGIAAKYPYTEGLTGVFNPYALRWTSAAKTAVASMLAFQTELIADPVTGLQADSIALAPEGHYVKTSYWKRNDLGILPWTFNNNGASGSGLKRVGVAVANNWTPFSNGGIYATKYDGTQLKPQLSNSTTPTVKDGISLWNTGALFLDIANAETGWGENYNPTDAEVNAFRLGWKMFDLSLASGDGTSIYNGSGAANKRWTPLDSFDGTRYYGSSTIVPTNPPSTSNASGYTKKRDITSYQLVYLMATQTQTSIASEGMLSLTEGDNIIEVGSGLVVRERATPQIGSIAYLYINGATDISSKLALRVGKFLNVQKNNRIDPAWSVLSNSAGNIPVYGNEQVRVDAYNYDPTAVYSASYFTMDKFPTVAFQGSFAISEKSLLKEIVTDVQQATARVAAVENRPQDAGAPIIWIQPTLLNGWTNISGRPPLSYMLQNGIVHVRGEVSGGVLGQPACYLPVGMRPAYSAEYVIYSWSGSAISAASLVVLKEGAIQVQNGSNNQISIGEIVFATV